MNSIAILLKSNGYYFVENKHLDIALKLDECSCYIAGIVKSGDYQNLLIVKHQGGCSYETRIEKLAGGSL